MGTKEIKISVIIPSYKPGTYVFECLDSLMNQSFDARSMEIVLVLNGCDDPYHSRIRAFMDSRAWAGHFILIQTDTPGVSNARNLGLDASNGTYVAFVDDDDFVSPTYLAELYKVASNDTIAVSNELRFREADRTTQKDIYSRYFSKKAPSGRQTYRKMRKFFSAPWMKLIHRDIISSFRFDTRFSNGEDSLFFFLISCNMKYVDFTSPDAVYYRRIRPESLVSKEKDIRFVVRNRLKLSGEFVRVYSRKPLAYSPYFLLTRVLACFHSMLICVCSALRS